MVGSSCSNVMVSLGDVRLWSLPMFSGCDAHCGYLLWLTLAMRRVALTKSVEAAECEYRGCQRDRVEADERVDGHVDRTAALAAGASTWCAGNDKLRSLVMARA